MAGDVRRECMHCGVHTFRSECGNCGSIALRRVDAEPEPARRFARERRRDLAGALGGRGLRPGTHSF
jgi:rRNA maturation protein Nop10